MSLRITNKKPVISRSSIQPYSYQQRGFTFTELLVSAGVMAVGMLGMLTMQKFLVVKYEGSYLHTQAILNIQELSERMHANPVGVQQGEYVLEMTGSVLGKSCVKESCSPAELAAFDLNEWFSGLEAVLPDPEAIINRVGLDYTISLEWSDVSVKPQTTEERKRVTFIFRPSVLGTEAVSDVGL